MVRERGFEPLRHGHGILSPARLPIPPLSHFTCIQNRVDFTLLLYKAQERFTALRARIPCFGPFVGGNSRWGHLST